MRIFSIAVAVLVSVAQPVSASLITFTDAMTAFTYDSDVQSAGFNAALGAGYTHLSFEGATNTDGASYSTDVTFSTKIGIFGGSNSPNVNASAEIGPFGSWDGVLNIDFLANGNTVSAVGFGLVSFDTPVETIRVYNESNLLIGVFNNQLPDLFSLWGVAGNAGERIGRVELDGNFFAIQDIEFNAQAATVPDRVPEPVSTLLLLGVGLTGVDIFRRRKA